MTDSLKFGPEWLRNLTQPSESGLGGTGGGPSNSITPRYQLADYRYGREEMLAMFGNIKPIVPEGLDSFQMLFAEKPLPPLALIQMTEDETRMWQRGINSEVVARTTGYGRGAGPIPPVGGRGLPLQQNSTNYGPGIGRGRGRFSNGRGRYEEDAPREPGGFPITNYASRGRFERSVQSGPERTWPEKSGENGAEWSGGAVSPRREMKPFFGKPPIDNWRNNIEGGVPEEQPTGRRPSGGSGIKWNRNNSWRSETGGKDRDDWHGEGDHLKYQDMENEKDGDKRYGQHIDPNFRILEAIKEVKEISQRKEILSKELDELDKKVKYYEEQEKSGSCEIADYAASFTKKHSIQSDIKKLGEIEESLIDKIKQHLAQNPRAAEMDMGSGRKKHSDPDLPEWATTNPGDEGGSFDDSGAFHGGVFFCDVNSEHGNPPANKQNSEPSPERAKEGHKNARNRVEEDKREEVKRHQQQQQQQQHQQQPPKQVSHVKPIIPQYGPDETNLKKQAAKNEQNKDQQQINILPLILGEKNQGEKWPEKLVNEVVKDETNDNSSSSSAKEAFWFYLDPQGFEQGKFSSEQMLAWTKSGFFPHNLQVRRASENFFSDICQFAAIWEQAKPAQEPARTEAPLLPSAHVSSASTPTNNVVNNTGGKVFENVRDIQAEYHIRQYEEIERMRFERLSFEPDDGYVTPDESFEAKSYDKQMIWSELKKEKERRDVHKGLGGSFGSYLPLDPILYPSLKPSTAWLSQWIQKQCAKLAIGKKRFLPEEKELLILFKLHEKKLELAKIEKDREEQDRKVVMRVLPTVAPESTWSMPSPQMPESVWGHETSPAQQPAARRVDSLWGDLEPIPMPHSTVASSIPTASSLWGLPTSNGLHHQRQQFTGQFDKVEADALELEKLAAEATSRRDNHRREENLRIQKEIEAAKRAIEKKRLEDEQKMQEELAEKQRQDMIRQREMEREKERILIEQEMMRKKMEEEAAARQLEMERRVLEEEEIRRDAEERKKKNKKVQEEALKKQQQQQQQAARKKELEMQSVQQVEAQMKQQKQEQMKKQQLEMQRQLEVQRQQEQRKQQELMLEQQRKKAADAKAAAKAAKTAPWLQQAAVTKNSVSLAEIQKLQMEETQKEMAAIQEQRIKLQKEFVLEDVPMKTWDGTKHAQSMLNLQQIQEEQKKSRLEAATLFTPPPVAAPVVNTSSNTWNSAWTQPPTQTAGIWGVTNTVSIKAVTKPVHSPQPAAPMPVAAMPASIWNADPEPAQSTQKSAASPAAAASKKKPTKSKSKKEEAQIMKMFESKSSKFSDDFTAWCVQSLSALESDVDIPTFVGFLKDIESPFDINDYVRSYLGSGQDAREFAKNFVEKRSKWRNAQKKAVAEDDMCKPAQAVNPNDCDFMEVKGKPKKAKKKPMQKVDSRILGFSVTAAPDRLNVGDRDYGE